MKTPAGVLSRTFAIFTPFSARVRHLALQNSSAGGKELLQGVRRRRVEGLGQQEHQSAGREAAQTENPERNGRGHRALRGRYNQTAREKVTAPICTFGTKAGTNWLTINQIN